MWQCASHASGGGVNARGGCGAGCGGGIVGRSTRCAPVSVSRGEDGAVEQLASGADDAGPLDVRACRRRSRVASMAAVNTPVGCSHTIRVGSAPGRSTDAAGESGSQAAVATETAPSTPIASCTRCGMNVRVRRSPPSAGGETSVILGTLAAVTSPRFIIGPAWSRIDSTRARRSSLRLELVGSLVAGRRRGQRPASRRPASRCRSA